MPGEPSPTFLALQTALAAGAGTADDLTRDLDAARGLADRIEALVAAHRELEEPTPVPGG
jgi:hypothetical protein